METNELGDSRSFLYDAMGNLVRKTDRNARVTQYEYDQTDRMAAEKWYSGTSSTPSIAITTTTDGVATNEVQKVGYSRGMGGPAPTGTFTLAFGGYTTGNIAAGASAATVQAAFEALTSIGSGNVSVTKSTDTSLVQEWQITFQGSLAGTNVAQVDINVANIVNFPSGVTQIETTTTQGAAAPNEVQTVALSNATGGTFRLAYRGQTTAPLAYNASSSTVDSALEALSTIGSGNVTVSLAGSTYTVTFVGALASTNANSLQGDISTATYGTVDRTISFTYNTSSQLTQVSDPSATIDYTLDNLYRATSIVNTIAGLTPTVTFDQVFNAASDRTQLKAKISSTNDFKTDFTFDTLGRMTDIVQQSNSGNTVASKHVTLAYNKLGQFTSFNRYESTGTSNQVASTDFQYDSLHNVTDIDHKQGGTTLASYDYTYDFAERMTSVTSAADGATVYTHDINAQLTGADFTGQTDETYTFDDNGNRTGGSYTVNSNNLTSTDGTYNYLYDDEGNRTRRTKISDSSYEDYTWDYRNRLTKVTFKNSGGTTLKTVEYAYDANNRLIRRTYDSDGPGGGAAVDQFWAFDEGINPLIEFDANTSADVSHRYLWGPQVDQLFADEQVTSTGSAGNVLWALGDNLGSIRDIADLSGGTTTVTNHRRFGAYGNVVSESNAAVDLVFAFTGKLYDEVTGLQNNLNRWYDAKLGQWMSEDPLGIEGKDANLRRAMGNKVEGRIDPDGLRYVDQGLRGDDGDWIDPLDPETGWREVGSKAPPSASRWSSWSPLDDYGNWANKFLPDFGVDDDIRAMLGDPYLAGAGDLELITGTVVGTTVVVAGAYVAAPALAAALTPGIAGGGLIGAVGSGAVIGATGAAANYGVWHGVGNAGAWARGGPPPVFDPWHFGSTVISGGATGGVLGGAGYIARPLFSAAGSVAFKQLPIPIQRGLSNAYGWANRPISQIFGSGGSSLTRGAALRAKFGSFYNEYSYFRNQGFTPRQSQYLAQPYQGMGHHFPIPRQTARAWGLPGWLRESPFNVLRPWGMSRGQFYQLHYQVDPSFHGTAFPRSVGGVWRGAQLGLTRYGQLGRWWYGLPGPTKIAGGGLLTGGAAGGVYWLFGAPNEG